MRRICTERGRVYWILDPVCDVVELSAFTFRAPERLEQFLPVMTAESTDHSLTDFILQSAEHGGRG